MGGELVPRRGAVVRGAGALVTTGTPARHDGAINRTNRMYAITEELRRAGSRGATGARLARMLEVSPRTVKRDIAALQEAGAPIWTQADPGGGYAMAGTASLPPINFTPAQAVAVAIAWPLCPRAGGRGRSRRRAHGRADG